MKASHRSRDGFRLFFCPLHTFSLHTLENMGAAEFVTEFLILTFITSYRLFGVIFICGKHIFVGLPCKWLYWVVVNHVCSGEFEETVV